MAVLVLHHQDTLKDHWAKGLTGIAASEQKLLAAELSVKNGHSGNMNYSNEGA